MPQESMRRYCFYIDGFNVYYALQSNPAYHKYKWLNYRKLAESVIRAKDTITGIYYFTALVRWRPDNVARHVRYIKALRWAGVNTIEGRFMNKQIKCHICNRFFETHEEKRTDVNIALQVFGDAIEDVYDRAVIISADSDLLPVITSIEKHSPEKEIGIMFPIGRTHFELRSAAHFRLKMPEKLLRSCQLPDTVTVGKTIIRRPETWY